MSSGPFKLIVVVSDQTNTAVAATTLDFQYMESAETAFEVLAVADDVRVIRAYSPDASKETYA
jgi:hypothetical protein